MKVSLITSFLAFTQAANIQDNGDCTGDDFCLSKSYGCCMFASSFGSQIT